MNKLNKSIKRLNKTEKRLKKARAERIWIENNSHIHILNYPYYKLKRSLTAFFTQEVQDK